MLFTLLAITLVAIIAFFIIREMKLEEPLNKIVLLIVGAILLFALLSLLGGFGPWPEHLRRW